MCAISYSILIPVYNSTDSLNELCDRLINVFETQVRDTFEVVFVNDGSPNPESWNTLKNLVNRHNNIIAINLLKNAGKGAAVLCGLHHVRGKHIVIMDDDLQHLPEDIPLLLQAKEHDIVLGSFKKKKHSLFKRVTSHMKGYFDQILLHKPKGIQSSPFQLVKREVIEGIKKMNVSQPFILGLLFSVSLDVVNVPVSHAPRKHGKSQYTLRKLFAQFSNLLFNYSALPLKFVSCLGVTFFMVSLALSGYLLYKKFHIGVEVPGWTSLVVIQLLTSGLILLSLGIMGEYFARLIKISEKRPAYTIREIINGNKIL